MRVVFDQRLLGYVCILVGFVLHTCTAVLQECPNAFFAISDSCYFVYNGTRDLYSWSEARTQCKKLHPDADLLEIHNQATQDAMDVIVSLVSWPVWIGLRGRESSANSQATASVNASFEWVSYGANNFSNWASDAFKNNGTQNASDNLCVFLSTASLQVGVWERADCERTRLGFACQLATHRPSQPPQGTLENDAASPGPLSAASDDQSCYLGTCYRLLPEAPKRTYFEAKAACGDAEVALPRNPLELAFLRARLASVSSVKRVWLGIEIEFSQGHLEFARGLVLTPWLTGAIHRSLPLSFFQSTSNHSETFCLQMDVAPSSSKDPFVAVPCTEAGAWNVTAFCAITETPRRACGDDNWYQFGEECFAVLSGCGNISGPANLKTPEQQAFAAWLIASSDYSDEKVLIGGTVNTASPLSITWSDGSVGTGFNRLKPALWQKDVSRNGLCLAMEPRTGWWVFSECEKQEFVLCSAPTPLEPTLPASVEQNTFAPDTTISCPEGYFLRLPKEDPSPVTCYRVVLGGVRSHTHDWRTAERTCRQVSAAGDASSRWVGHLASLPIASISDEVLSVLRQRGIETGIYALDNASKLPAHMIHTSDLVWIGLSRTESKLFWRKWTDGSDGDTAFYEDQIRQQRSFFADSPGYFFDHGSCIALHLPSGTWYPLRCTLDLGYLCQAVLTSSDQPEEVTENVDTPSCLVQPNGLHSVLSNETGFIHDPVVDCSAPGFTFFNGQCFRAISDKFMTFAEAQTYCHEIGSPYSRNGDAGLAILRSDADQLFAASLLSHLPNLPETPTAEGSVSPENSRLEAIWRRYHWIGLFNYRHAYHAVNERFPCYIAHELIRVPATDESPVCISIMGVPEGDHFGTLSSDVGCNKRLPFVCSFQPPENMLLSVATAPSTCPRGFAAHHSATGDHCYKFIRGWTGSYEEAAKKCASADQGAHLASLSTPFSVAWMRAHLPSDHTTSGVPPWESTPHWIGLRLSGKAESTWRWANGLPVTHTRWSAQPSNLTDSSTETCFAFAKSISLTSYELDMVVADCSRQLSPLCETEPSAFAGGRQRVPDTEPPVECSQTPDQRDYAGFLAETATGKPCIRWDLVSPTDSNEFSSLAEAFRLATLKIVAQTLAENSSQTPSQNLYSPAFQPTFSAASNWCRNPSGLRDRAFCYVDPFNWDYCEVPSCPRAISGRPAFPYVFLTLSLTALFLGIIIYVYRKGSGDRRSPFLNRLSTIAMAWRKRTSSEPCLLADNVTFSSGLASGDATQQIV